MSNGTEFDRSILFREKERLSDLPYFQPTHGIPESGVLLSDRIKRYCKEDCKLISPYVEDLLRPAGYDLRVGFNYALGGKVSALSEGQPLVIGPYQVAVIQTWETLNIPEFLIGRWNIRVMLAYQGLLWVGGAQVDPGFRGRLSCPIYNLSTEPVELMCGDKLAMIDFVTTTSFVEGQSKPFQWWHEKKLIFDQYPTGLSSGVEANLQKIHQEVEASGNKLHKSLRTTSRNLRDSIDSLQSRIDGRIDTFLTLVFTVVAVLFAGLGIIATKGSDDPSFVSSPVWIAAVALYFGLKPYAIVWAESRRNTVVPTDSGTSSPSGDSWIENLRPRFVEVLIATIIVCGSLAFHAWHAHVSARELANEKRQVEQLAAEVKQQRESFDTQIKAADVRAEARSQSLQKQIEFLRPKR